MTRLTVECTLPQRPANETATVCDAGGNCTTVGVTLAALGSQAVANQPELPAALVSSIPASEPAPAAQPASSAPNPPWARPAARPVDLGVIPIRWNGSAWPSGNAPRPAEPDLATAPLQATVTVVNTNDSGPGSLRQALLDAASGDTIIFHSSLSGQTITLASTLTIDKNLTVDGSSLAAPVTISDNDAVRVFYVNSGVTAELKALQVVHGYILSPDEGAGLINYGALTVTNSTFDANVSGGQGGGIQNNGTLTVKDSTFSNNSAPSANRCGAGINNGGALDVSSSTFVNNHAGDCGSDGQTYSWQLYATDVNGNRTAQPYNLTVQVDNVAPVITATQTVTQVLIPNGAEVLRGTVTDGDVLSATWLLITDPLGNSMVDSVAGDATAWTYTFTPTLGGEYKFAVYAVDRAGNQAGVGTFSLTALQPLDLRQTVTPESVVSAGAMVRYTLWVANYNTAEAASHVIMTSTLSRWLTPVDTAGATFIEAEPDNLLVWPPTSLAAGAEISFTVLARMPNELVITSTRPFTQLVDLRSAVFTSLASLTTDNLGPSQAYACNFVAADSSALPYKIYLPLVTRNHAAAPDLVVRRVLATSNSVQVVIENQGDLPVKNEFWVDVYIAPTTPPTHVNQTWDMPGDQGLTWGVTSSALPALTPGGVLTLTVGDAYYSSDLSRVTWPLATGTPVYAQVDSANADSGYGAVLENHESIGGPYNNIAQTVSTSGASDAAVPPVANASPSTPATGSLPRRP